MATMDAMPNVILAVKEESLLQMIRDMLRQSSVESVKTFSSLSDAKATLRAHARKWDIFLIDSQFPEAVFEIGLIRKDEIGLIRKEMGPHVKILYMVGMPASKEEVFRAVRAGINGFIGMPFSQVTLEDKIGELMGKALSPRENSRTSILYQMD